MSPKSKINPHLDAVVEASVNGWCIFIITGITSEFYRTACQYLQNQDAARITLLHFYMNTFSAEERRLLLDDSHYFLHFADGFVKELLPHGTRDPEFFQYSRVVFKRAMKSLLSKDVEDLPIEISWQHRRDFMRGAISLTASIDNIITCWDKYKEYLNRYEPMSRRYSDSELSFA